MPAKIIVVEDEASLAELLKYNLQSEGYDVVHAADGEEAELLLSEQSFDLAILDWMIPKISGIELCRRLRNRSETQSLPIILLTARGEETDRVRGLTTGADDYVTKPYSPRELVARIRAVLRRQSAESNETGAPTLAAGPVRMDIERHVVTVGGAGVQLPLKEFELLELLLRNAGRVLTRGQLIDRVWGADYVGDTKTLDVHVKRLRSKIEPEPSAPRYIVTVRGLGYKFEP